jgi:hypothetical protein
MVSIASPSNCTRTSKKRIGVLLSQISLKIGSICAPKVSLFLDMSHNCFSDLCPLLHHLLLIWSISLLVPSIFIGTALVLTESHPDREVWLNSYYK